MKVVACFRCTSKLEREVDTVDVTFAPAYDDNGPNKSWSKYTPAGEIKLTITNPPAASAFKVGTHYFLSFEEATPSQIRGYNLNAE